MRELAIELPGTKSNTILIDNQGKLLKRALISSSDGSISLLIEPGTILLNENNTPLPSIKVTIDSAIPVPPENTKIVGLTVDIQPQGATASPAIQLTLKYDSSSLPLGVNENDLWVYNYSGSGWEMERYKNIDTGANRVMTTISRLGKYSVLAPIEPATTPLTAPQAGATSLTLQQALSNGKPTLAEFGSSSCVPCKQMKPILEQLTVDYRDRLNVVIVEVYEQPELTNSFRIMSIPTQIVFDSSGKEVTRHIGLWPRDKIEAQLGKMGVK